MVASIFGAMKKNLKHISRMLRVFPLSLIGVVIILSYVVVAFMAPVLAPPTESNPFICPYDGPPDRGYGSGVLPAPVLPNSVHPFGTFAGFDVYYGCIWGTRLAFYLSILVTLLTLAVGFIIGSISGYFEGWVDEILMRFTDAFFALPGLVYVIMLVTFMPLHLVLNVGGYSIGMGISQIDRIIIALAIVGWPPYARFIRAEIKKVKVQDFVEAAKAAGCSRLRVLFKHVLPNSITAIASLVFLNIGGVVIAGTTVSFLGFGFPRGYAEWGTILSYGRSYLVVPTGDTVQFALMLFVPGAFISVFILGWSLLGDALISLMDPTVSRRTIV